MQDLALEQIRHGRQADMRMRPNIQPASSQKLARSHLIEEDERPDHLALPRRQRAPHLEAADVMRARQQHRLNP